MAAQFVGSFDATAPAPGTVITSRTLGYHRIQPIFVTLDMNIPNKHGTASTNRCGSMFLWQGLNIPTEPLSLTLRVSYEIYGFGRLGMRLLFNIMKDGFQEPIFM